MPKLSDKLAVIQNVKSFRLRLGCERNCRMSNNGRPDFERLASSKREFKIFEKDLIGHVPTIAITPVADGRVNAFEDNSEKTWRMAEKVYDLIDRKSVV